MPKEDIKWALSALRQNAGAYQKAVDYYEGKHPLGFATEKFRNQFGRLFNELSINHCAVCVDVPADKLQLTEFKVLSGDASAAAKVAEIWRRNRMNKRAGEVHTEALKTGDAFVVVDWTNSDDPSTDRATIYPNQAGRCAVKYDDENPGYIIQAARWWVVRDGADVYTRLNIYYRDTIEKYTTRKRSVTSLPEQEKDFEPIVGDWLVPNKLKKVPVFHFANNAPIGSLGVSENANIYPPQNGLNKAVCDAMVGAEYAAMGQRYVAGLEVDEDENGNPIPPFKDGLANLWVAPPQKNADGEILSGAESQPVQFGQFSPANLDQLLSIKSAFRQDISVISGIPSHYFMDANGGWPSGEALKTAEARLTAKVKDRQIAFGNVWEDVMRFCLEIEGVPDVTLEAQWENASPVVAQEAPVGATN